MSEKTAREWLEARDAAFAKVKRTTNVLGAWEPKACPYDHERMWKDGFDAGYESHIAGWVRVEDGLPEERKFVLVTCCGEDGIPYTTQARWFNPCWYDEVRMLLDPVTAWRLIPDPIPPYQQEETK